jgi:hypothetical protein
MAARRTEEKYLLARVKSFTLYNGRANVTVEPEALYVKLPVQASGAVYDAATGEQQLHVDQAGLEALITGSLTRFEDAEFDRAARRVKKQS